MAILLHTDRNRELWIDGFGRTLPGTEVRLWPDTGDKADIDYLVTWLHDWSDLPTHPNLKAILLVSAGIDHVDFDQIPEHLPVVRLVDPEMSADIAEYCTHWVTHFGRHFDIYRRQQSERHWDAVVRGHRATVGILGFGEIGRAIGQQISALGHHVISWSRTAKDTPFGRHHVGPSELLDFMDACEVAINVLPLSDATRGLIDDDALSALGNGVFINVGRGATVDTDAIVRSLDGALRAAVLDVFSTEPLPAASPLWDHPKVIVTPHVSGETNPISAAAIIAENIRRIERGEEPTPLVSRDTY